MTGSDYASEVERLRIRRQASAEEAWGLGRSALASGDLEAASKWLDRARRLAPGDPTVVLALATTWLRQGRPEARDLFDGIASQHDVRPAWVGLAAARYAQGDTAGAAEALAKTLAGHAGDVDDSFESLVRAIALAHGDPGWCTIAGPGTIYIGLRPATAGAARRHQPQIVMDGRAASVRVPRSGRYRLPRGSDRAGRLEVAIEGRELLGSPIDLRRLRQTDGFVEVRDGGIAGWAWLPADPETDPLLRLVPESGGPGFAFPATDTSMTADTERPLARPRRFQIAAERLAGLRGAVRVLGPDGRDLLGSPLDPSAEARSAAGLAAALACRFPAKGSPRRVSAVPAYAAAPADIIGPKPPTGARQPTARSGRASVVVPVYGRREIVLQCIGQVLATVPRGTRLIVVDDASPDRDFVAELQRFATRNVIQLHRHARNRGFPASANTGLRAAGGTDVVLLNSDTLVAEGWLERLRDAAYAAADVGTATPFSNEATILGYPSLFRRNPVPDHSATRRLAALAHRANAGRVVEIPTAVGFCMYIRRDCLDAVGLFREDVFAQGYGEENDFCIRARHLGWRHVAACGVFVTHIGGQSFGAGRHRLLARNLATLNRMHPGYDQLIADHNKADPLADARRRFDIARWRSARARRKGNAGSVLLITHDRGGGVQRQVEARIAALRADGLHPIVLSPVLRNAEPAYAGECRVGDGSAEDYSNLRFTLPRELGSLARFLRPDRVVHAELHHLLGHDHSVLELCRHLGVPYDTYVHDYAWFCPRISLLGPDRRYCGEPEAARCEACVRDAGRKIEEDISVASLRRRSAADLATSRRVIAPSADAAARISRHFAAIRPTVVPWEDEPPAAPRQLVAPPSNGERRVCLIGAIGPEKGYDVLLEAARDAAERALPLRFIVVGHTIDDDRLLATGRVFVTGEYREAEATSLIEAQCAHLAWLPSIWPETWCFALSEAWRAGLDVVAFDIGAPAERIRRSGRGILLPLGLPPAALNQAFLARGAAGAPS